MAAGSPSVEGEPTGKHDAPPDTRTAAVASDNSTSRPSERPDSAQSSKSPTSPRTVELPFEAALYFDKTSLSVENVQAMLQSKRFQAQMDAFENQIGSNAEASAMTDVYRASLKAQFEKNQLKADIGKVVCGVSVCVGYLRNGSDSEYRRWSDIFFNDPTTPGYAFFNSSVDLGAGAREYRFAFSTDSAINGVSTRAR